MTREEYKALVEIEKEIIDKYEKFAREEWEKIAHIVAFPFPENFLRFTYRNSEIYDEAYDLFEDVFQTLLPDVKEVVLMLMRDKDTLDEVADKLGLMTGSVLSYLKKAARLMKATKRTKRFGDSIKFAKSPYNED